MPPDRQQHHFKAHEIHRGKGLVVRLSLAVAVNTLHVTARFGSAPPNFETEHPVVDIGLSTSLPLPPTSREDLRLDDYLEYPHAVKALYIYKQPCPLLIRTKHVMSSSPVPLKTRRVGVRCTLNLSRAPISSC
ncbi:hypothetical protein TNCV_1066041 [Trichonephila clavipes]|nr:hypothetical protein TNCV_1066041 [Trichonephila clavipes]